LIDDCKISEDIIEDRIKTMNKKITLNVDGMNCGHCSAMVLRTLEGIEGITDVSVDLEGKKASFQADDATLVDTAIQEISKAGYKAGL
jgi:copper chaperone CopZ